MRRALRVLARPLSRSCALLSLAFLLVGCNAVGTYVDTVQAVQNNEQIISLRGTQGSKSAGEATSFMLAENDRLICYFARDEQDAFAKGARRYEQYSEIVEGAYGEISAILTEAKFSTQPSKPGQGQLQFWASFGAREGWLDQRAAEALLDYFQAHPHNCWRFT